MSAPLEGFLSMWDQAHATFGSGTPSDGTQFDQSSQLLQLQDTVTSAAPNSGWTGAAADSYADANSTHARTLGNLADLDKRLGAEVGRSAAVVAAGRRDLEAVRKWVVDAASTVPNTAAGQRMLWPVVSQGSKDLQEIINRSNGDLSAIAQRIRVLGGEYDQLGKGAKKLDKPNAAVPPTALDLNDIVHTKPLDPNHPLAEGPLGYKELVPNSGVWVPDPSSQFYEPTPVEKPLDLDDIVQIAPYSPDGAPTLGPSGYVELVPHSGTWVPDPNGAMWPTDPPTAPVDLTKIVVADPGALGEPWQIELIPHSGVWVPDPHYGGPR